MKQLFAKIIVFLVIFTSITSCNVVKRVGENDHLLTDVNIYVNDKKTNREEITNLSVQKPNTKVAGIPFSLHFYNMARPNIDSILKAKILDNPQKVKRKTFWLSKKQLDKHLETRRNFNRWIKTSGEAPVIIDSLRTEKTRFRLEKYFFNKGWFNKEVSFKINRKDNKRGSVDYYVNTGDPYILDSINQRIESPVIDSLYQLTKDNSHLKTGEQYSKLNYDNEVDRLTTQFRNSGVYHFTKDYVRFDLDTIGTNYKVNTEVQIGNRTIRNEDSVAYVPFKIWKIKEVNIITDDAFENRGKAFKDSISYENFNIYSYDDMRYKPKALTDAVFINKDSIYKDLDRTYTYRYLNELRTFRYPEIRYIVNEVDSTLTANILLTPRKKYGLGFDFNISQSNIQTVGFSFSTSLLARNVFKGAETLELSFLGAIGASKDGNENDPFFDINELGADLKLTIPRLFFPLNTDKVIPKYMSPTSRLSLGFTSQTNIGLDKQTVNGIVNYNWYPSETVTNSVDLFNAQYVRNLNPQNYFSVYQNSYNRLNSIAINTYNTPPEFIDNNELILNQADAFIDLVLADNAFQTSNPNEYQTVNNINERKERLTENNLILASNFNYTKDKRESVFDENFSIFRFKIEFAGNLLANVSNLLGLKKNTDNRFEIFNVAYSQYAKTEFDYIKHWDLGKNNVFALRTFFGIAIPYGNSSNIPFSRSFFAGGANDNRAWTAYDLGPGSSDSNDEFNEANMKLALNFEYRFKMFGDLNGALFTDIGNIWNVFDDVEDPKANFDGFSSLQDIAVGTGFGLRYDFSFLVLRFDIGFKTYDPSMPEGNRWFKDYNFSNAVFNIGINYPF